MFMYMSVVCLCEKILATPLLQQQANNIEIGMVKNSQGILLKVVILWDLDNKPPRMFRRHTLSISISPS